MERIFTIIGKALGICVLLYLSIVLTFYWVQDDLLFQSESLQRDYKFSFDQKFEEYFVKTSDGEELNAILFKAPHPAKGLILYFHGNADNLQRWGQYATDFTKLGYDILMTDYRGYGKSTGQPDEQDFYQDAITIYNWSAGNLKYHRLIIYGRSLGAAVASNLAMKVAPDLLILETPFDDVSSVLYELPSKYSFPNNEFLPNVKCRRIIFHGTKDRVVPLASASKLKPFLTANDQFIIVEGASHNNLREFEKFNDTLREVLE